MRTMILTLIMMLIVMDAGCQSCQAGEKSKIHEVGVDELMLQGRIESDDRKVKVSVGEKAIQLPAKLFLVKLSAGKKYRVGMDSKEIDSVLVVQNEGGNQMSLDDDSGGGLNSLLTLDVLKGGIYKIYAASFKGSGMFSLRMQDGGEVKLYEVGVGLTINDELRKSTAITYNVKLVAGKTYVIDMISPNQEALDPFLQLLDAEGKELAMDDDGGDGLNARIAFQAAADDTYQIVAACIGKGRGPFTLTVHEGKKEDAFKFAQLAQATKVNDEAIALYRAGKSLKAEPLFRQALEIREKALGKKHRDYAGSLNNLAVLYTTQGDYAKAEPLYRQALEIEKEVLGEKHTIYASNLHNLAGLYTFLGDYAKAEPLYRQALEIRKEVLGEKHAKYASTLNNLGGLYESQGNYAKSEPLCRQALEIRKETLGEKHADYSESLSNLAYLLHNLQRNDSEAERLYRRAIEIRKEMLGDKHPDYVTSLSNLAFLYSSQGNYAEAELLFREAVEIRKEVLGDKHPNYAASLNNLAGLYNSQGNYAKAEPYFRQALVASQIAKTLPFERLQSDDLRIHPNTVRILRNHAGTNRKLVTSNGGQELLRISDRSFLFGLSVLNRIRQDTLDQEESKIQLTSTHFDMVADRIEVLSQLFALEKNSQDLEAAFWTAEQGMARAFLESLGKSRANVLASISPKQQSEEMVLLQDIRTLDRRLDKESAKALDKRNPDLIGQLFSERREAEGKLKQLIGDLENDYPQYAGFKYPRPCNLDEARACLAPDEVSLHYVPGTTASFLVLVEARPTPVDRTNGLAIFELPSSARITDAVAALSDPETLALPRANTLARKAFEMLLGPYKDSIKDKNLVIVPNGQLCFLPFELLVEEDGKYLIEKHRIRYAPSLTALHLINLWKQKRGIPEESLFAVGDPLYEKEFQRLEHSAYEVAEIVKVLKAKTESVLMRGKASKAEVKKASDANVMAKARYVHFATHGILGVDRGKQPALVLTQTGQDFEECFLQMDEITSLKLNADLVVLSACKSGQGRLHQGEGVTGLARAFLYAGSKGVVCSLWSVDDRETANLMIDFYGYLQKGRSAPDALREAQLAMIRAGKAPLYWAPFIFIGE